MPNLLDLPPELFDPIFRATISLYISPDDLSRVAQRINLQKVVRLRRVNKLFNQHVLFEIERRELFNPNLFLHQSHWCRVCQQRWHPSRRRELMKDHSWFEARYLLSRPHVQQPWNSNISALFNHLLDKVYELENSEQHQNHHPQLQLQTTRRYQDLRMLCHAIGIRAEDSERMDLHGILPWLFSNEQPITPRPVEFFLACAHIILGKEQWVDQFLSTCDTEALTMQSEVFGSLLETAVRARRSSITAKILKKGADVNSQQQNALHIAIQNDDLATIKHLLDPEYGHLTSGVQFERHIITAIQICDPEVPDFLLDRADTTDMPYVAHDGFRDACFNGDIDLVERLLDIFPAMDINGSTFWNSRQIHSAPVTIAIRGGHHELLRVLLAANANPWGEANHFVSPDSNLVASLRAGRGLHPIVAAAERGDIPSGRELVHAGLWLSLDQWTGVIERASFYGQSKFVEFLVAEGVVPIVKIANTRPPLLRRMFSAFANKGDEESIQVLISNGVPIDRNLLENLGISPDTGKLYHIPQRQIPRIQPAIRHLRV